MPLPLTHAALQSAHWHAIFVGMGERYEEDWTLTVEELLSYNLAAHQGLIDAIFSRARAEYRLEQKLNKVQRLWTSVDVYFKLAKHIPDSVYNAGKFLARWSAIWVVLSLCWVGHGKCSRLHIGPICYIMIIVKVVKPATCDVGLYN